MGKLFIDRERTASFDVDAQCGFSPLCPNELPVPDGHNIVGELNAQAQYASVRIGSKDAHSPNAAWVATQEAPQFTPVVGLPNVDIRWNRHCEVGTPGFELLPGLPAVEDYNFFVYKGVERTMHPYGACYHDKAERRSTGVLEFLNVRDIDTVIIGGLATDYCVKTTALQLRNSGIRVFLNLAACRGISDETVTAAISEMRAAGVVFISNAAALQQMMIRGADARDAKP